MAVAEQKIVPAMARPMPLYHTYKGSDGRLRIGLNLHEGQAEAWDSSSRFVAVIAGTQSGKTSFGSHWLLREIKRAGAGDYMVVTPTFKLLEYKALKEFRIVFEQLWQLGMYYASPIRRFVFSEHGMRRIHGAGNYDPKQPTTVFFGHADNPDSLESATLKGLWADEAGQKRFRLGSWEALQRRLSLHEGRALITTTPYDLGWLYSEIYLRYKAGDKSYHVVTFASSANPAFPQRELERMRALLPAWKFKMFYLGEFSRPAGLIYDAFDASNPEHVQYPWALPQQWPLTLGLDFGAPNIAATIYRTNPTSRRHYLYGEYRPHASKTAAEHAAALYELEPQLRILRPNLDKAIGGAKSEGQWRNEFRAAGLVLSPSLVHEVEIGIDRAYGAMKQGRFTAFNNCRYFLDEVASYSRELDDKGEPTSKIADKEKYHTLDTVRYAMSWAERPNRGWTREAALLLHPDGQGAAPVVKTIADYLG